MLPSRSTTLDSTGTSSRLPAPSASSVNQLLPLKLSVMVLQWKCVIVQLKCRVIVSRVLFYQ